MNEHSGNSGQLQPPGAAAGLNEPFGDSEQLGTDAASGGDAHDIEDPCDVITRAAQKLAATGQPRLADRLVRACDAVEQLQAAALAAHQPVGIGRAIYQVRYRVTDGWTEVSEEGYGHVPSWDRRVLYTAPPAPEMSPDFTDTARAAIAWVLWHHQGGGSAIGQPLRYALGMGDHEELSAQQISEAKRYAESVGARTDDFKRPAPAAVPADTFQAGVSRWMGECFLPSLYSNMTERGDRLLEEVLELLQSHGYDQARVATLVDYVYGRPVGEPAQEVGGVMVTLAGYCWVAGMDMHAEGARELERITQPEVMAKIRRKQEAKNALHFDTPLPGHATHRQPAAACVNINATRYLYLRAQPVEGGPWGTPRIAIPSSERAGEFANGDDADAAIDAAIAAQQVKPEVGNG